MQCPQCQTELQPVKTRSHYDLPIEIDQCPACGGLWFDQNELFSIKPTEAELIEAIDIQALCSPSELRSRLICPRDLSELRPYSDPNFPSSIQVEKCPVCQGFWFNHGEFEAYQNKKQKKPATTNTSKLDAATEASINRMLTQYKQDPDGSQLARLGAFLSTPVDHAWDRTRPAAEDSAQNFAYLVVDILRILFRILLKNTL